MKYYARPNHQLKKESEDYKYLSQHFADNLETDPEYIAWWSSMLFNVGYVLKLESFQPNDLPDGKMEIKAEPSKAVLKQVVFTKMPPVGYTGPNLAYYQHLHDWDIKIENGNADYRLKARHLPNQLGKGLELEFVIDSNKAGAWALGGMVFWILLLVVFYYAGLGFLGILGAGAVAGIILYFALNKIMDRYDREIPENNAVFEFYKKYLASNFDLEKIEKA
jgi:hypothetical protein